MVKEKPKPPPPFRFGKPEKRNWIGIIFGGLFIAAGVIAIVWMVEDSPRQHRLICHSDHGNGLWSAMGRCTEE